MPYDLIWSWSLKCKSCENGQRFRSLFPAPVCKTMHIIKRLMVSYETPKTIPKF